MNPAEVALAFKIFVAEVSKLDGNGLIDEWIKLETSDEQIPDLDLQKQLYLEQALMRKFGLMEWRRAVDERKASVT